MSTGTKFVIIGSTSDEYLFFSYNLAKRISSLSPSVVVDFSPLSELEYTLKLNELRSQYGGIYYKHNGLHLVTRDDKYVGENTDLIKIAKIEFGIEDADITNMVALARSVKDETAKILSHPRRQYCFFEFVDGSPKRNPKAPYYGRVVIELFNDICPDACENFMALCTGSAGRNAATGTVLHYASCPIHRVVKDGWFQTGDIVDGSGTNSMPAIPCAANVENNSLIRDESFSVDFGLSVGGIVGYSNDGPHRNGSQFFITLGPCEWMNTKYVGIGRLLYGHSTLRNINKAPTTSERPMPPIIIGESGKEKI